MWWIYGALNLGLFFIGEKFAFKSLEVRVSGGAARDTATAWISAGGVMRIMTV
jgi:hypothetical protein